LEVEMSSEYGDRCRPLGGRTLDHDLVIEGLLHSEGWLDLERPAPKEAKDSRGSAEPEPYERPVLA